MVTDVAGGVFLGGRRVTPAMQVDHDAAVMGLHKLTAGDGYMYLIRQVAAGDATNRGRPSLGDYYSAKGEAPGTLDGPRTGRAGRAGRP